MSKCKACGYNNVSRRTNCAQCGYLLKMFKMFAMALMLMLTACATTPKKDKLKEYVSDTKNANIYFVNKDIQPYFNRVLEMSMALKQPMAFNNIMIVFSDMEGRDDRDSYGYCTVIYGTPTIAISRKDWPNLGDARREALILHETLHCLKMRDHCNEKFEGKNVSVMHENLIEEEDYIAMREYYITEAFYPHPSCPKEPLKWLK